MKLSVIIPSKNVRNLVPCVEAVHEHDPGHGVLVIDDGLKLHPWPGVLDGSEIIAGAKPFVFARNANIGIQFALDNGCDAVILLNDDALLRTAGGFTRLAELALQHDDIGVVAPVTNITGQPLQKPHGVGLRHVPHIAFVCVCIPRRTIERIGILDERYCIDYGVEDRDYCEAINRAGLKVCVYDNVFVDHGSLVSSFRGDPKTPRSYAENLKLFRAKWEI